MEFLIEMGVPHAPPVLEVGQMTEQVTLFAVSASAVALQTDKSDVRTSSHRGHHRTMPLPGYRNYQSLINLVPAPRRPAFQNAVVDTPDARSPPTSTAPPATTTTR
jgi:hypothetical protein